MRRFSPTPAGLATIGALLVIALVFLDVNPHNPPGFFRDESAIAYNAYTLETTGRDEYGARFPLFIRSFGDYKSPLYVYLLAAVFRVTGPSIHAAKALSAVLGLAAVLVLFALALAISKRRLIALAVALLAGLSPWLFEISRLVFEVAIEPVLIALLLLVVHRAVAGTWRLRHSVAIGLLLAGIVYAYQTGRLLAPFLALGMILFFRKGRGRQVAATCGIFVATLVPLGIYALVHPGALQARYHAVTYIHSGISWGRIALDFAEQYGKNMNLWAWLVHGDPNARHHVHGAGSLFFVEVGLALAGIAIVLLRRRSDPWWRFVLFAVVVTPIAGSLTNQTVHSLRMIALPVLVPVLAIPALEAIGSLQGRRRVLIASALALVFAVEVVHWQVVFHRHGPNRQDAFEAQVAPVIAAAFAHGGTVYASRDDHTTYIDTLFYGAVAGRKPSSIRILRPGQNPPPGSLVVGAIDDCHTCKAVAIDATWEAYLTPR